MLLTELMSLIFFIPFVEAASRSLTYDPAGGSNGANGSVMSNCARDEAT